MLWSHRLFPIRVGLLFYQEGEVVDLVSAFMLELFLFFLEPTRRNQPSQGHKYPSPFSYKEHIEVCEILSFCKGMKLRALFLP